MSENRLHTGWWKEFWSNLDKQDKTAKVRDFHIGEVRLNPEVKIRYRVADKNLKQYFTEKTF